MFLSIFSAVWWLSVLISLYSARCISLQCFTAQAEEKAGFSLPSSHPFYSTVRVFLQYLYGLESTKPCQNIGFKKSQFPWPSVALHFSAERTDPGCTLGNSIGRITGISDWVFFSHAIFDCIVLNSMRSDN